MVFRSNDNSTAEAGGTVTPPLPPLPPLDAAVSRPDLSVDGISVGRLRGDPELRRPGNQDSAALPSDPIFTAHGFTRIGQEAVVECDGIAERYRHDATGAQVLFIKNSDQLRALYVGFITPPRDSKGREHPFEHLVFRGSKNFPVDQPFVELAKGSLMSDSNAFTGRDHTVYYCSAPLEKDLENHAIVTFDALFNPLLTQHAIDQEVCSIRLTEQYEQNPAADTPVRERFRLVGIVRSEMEGYYSDPQEMADEYAIRALFDGSPYSRNPFGDPATLHELTAADFQELAKEFYHPSNARIVVTGDIEVDGWLARLNELLSGSPAAAVQPSMELPELSSPNFAAPKAVVHSYPGGEGETKTRDTLVTLTWCLTDTRDPVLNLKLAFLSDLLYGAENTTLTRALIDSDLGEADLEGGLDSQHPYHLFSVGLSGIDQARADDFEACTLEALRKVSSSGFDPDLILAQFESFELALRKASVAPERSVGGAARGLEAWLRGADPIAALHTRQHFDAVRRDYAENPRLFEELAERFLLNNNTRIRVTMLPDRGLLRDWEQHEEEVVESLISGQDPEALEKELREKSKGAVVDSPEALASIPRLEVSDLPRYHIPIPSRRDPSDDRVLVNEVPAGGLLHADLVIPLRQIDPRVVPYVALLQELILTLPAGERGIIDLQTMIDRDTGGIEMHIENHATFGGEDWNSFFVVSGSALATKCARLPEFFDLLLRRSKLDDQASVRRLLRSSKADLESSLIQDGASWAQTRVGSHLTPEGQVDDLVSGIEYLRFIRNVLSEARSEDGWPRVARKLEEARDALLGARGVLLNVTGAAADAQEFLHRGGGLALVRQFPEGTPAKAPFTPSSPPSTEGFKIPSAVNFISQSVDLGRVGFKHVGAMHVIAEHIESETLWDTVRGRDGAYGAYLDWDSERSILNIGSSSDPNIASTLNIVDKIVADLRSRSFTRGELRRSIIRTIGRFDRPQAPDELGWEAFVERQQGWTAERRQADREEIFEAKIAHVREFVDALEAAKKDARTVVLGSKRNLTRFSAMAGVASMEISHLE